MTTGTVTLKIPEVAKRKGIENPFALEKATGINYAVCYRLWHSDQGRIDLKTLAALCDALDCQPGDLMTYIRGTDGAPAKGTGRKGKKKSSPVFAQDVNTGREASVRQTGIRNQVQKLMFCYPVVTELRRRAMYAVG